MTREQIQDRLVCTVIGNTNTLAEFCTGLGKTLAAIKCINEVGGRFLWIVPETVLIKNAQEEFVKHGYEFLLKDGDFICYQSLQKYIGQEYNIVVGDEFHWSSSDKRLEYLQQIKYRYLLGLSATVDDEVWEKIQVLGKFYKYKVTLTEAIDWGIISEPKMNIVYLDLDNNREDYEFTYSKLKKVKCTAKGYYDKLSESITYWRKRYEDGEDFAGNKMKSLGAERMRFLGKYKNEEAKRIIQSFGKERFICFCSSVEQAKYLGGKQAVSSQKTAKQNQELIDKFNEGKSNSLFAKALLQEGQNLVNTRYGLIIQLGNKERFVNQTLGRLLRHPSPEIYYIIVRGTADERFLENSTKSLNKEYFL